LKKQWDVQNQSHAMFDSFIKGKRFGKPDKQLHLSLIPVPFAGNLQRASIFILLMNPGLVPSDYYAEEDGNFRKACISNLRQSNDNEEFPLFYLNPEFAWSGGFVWWEALLRPILKKIMEHASVPSYYSALAFLAKEIAVIELIPYHSVDGSALKGRGNAWKNLPSARQAREFVNGVCRSEESPLVLVLRSQKLWSLDSHTNSKCMKSPATRLPTLNPKLDDENGAAGRAILNKLGIA